MLEGEKGRERCLCTHKSTRQTIEIGALVFESVAYFDRGFVVGYRGVGHFGHKSISQWVYGAMGTRSRDWSDDGRSAAASSADLLCFCEA